MKNISTFRVFRCYKTYDGLKDIEKRKCSSADNWGWSLGWPMYLRKRLRAVFRFFIWKKIHKTINFASPYY